MKRLKPFALNPRDRAAPTARRAEPLRSPQLAEPPATDIQGVTALETRCRPREVRLNQVAVDFMSDFICWVSGNAGAFFQYTRITSTRTLRGTPARAGVSGRNGYARGTTVSSPGARVRAAGPGSGAAAVAAGDAGGTAPSTGCAPRVSNVSAADTARTWMVRGTSDPHCSVTTTHRADRRYRRCHVVRPFPLFQSKHPRLPRGQWIGGRGCRAGDRTQQQVRTVVRRLLQLGDHVGHVGQVGHHEQPVTVVLADERVH